MRKKVSIVLCSYNEESNLPTVISAVHAAMKGLAYDYELIVVDDGSSDRSLVLLQSLAETDKQLFYIEFSRNFGHQNALKAGLDHASGDCIISMDADMQHPPAMLPHLLAKWEEGYDIVYTRRAEDPSLPALKRQTSKRFYQLLNMLSSVELEPGTADFRLMDRRAADVLIGLKENDPFVRGLVKWIGFRQCPVDYQPHERLSGKSKYTMRKMARLALHGILSFSTQPLFLALYIGAIFASLSLLYIPYVVYSLIFGHAISGWASLIVTIVFFGGLQLFILGIIGLYIGKIFTQVKQRPGYIVRSTNIL